MGQENQENRSSTSKKIEIALMIVLIIITGVYAKYTKDSVHLMAESNRVKFRPYVEILGQVQYESDKSTKKVLDLSTGLPAVLQKGGQELLFVQFLNVGDVPAELLSLKTIVEEGASKWTPKPEDTPVKNITLFPNGIMMKKLELDGVHYFPNDSTKHDITTTFLLTYRGTDNSSHDEKYTYEYKIQDTIQNGKIVSKNLISQMEVKE